ncbi:purine-cytosine permease-like protein [Kushneria sinocarnis]|uniref:Purine-cytosine permease-like protein n=1 Tax=Kushneria sinocarnis TaxID=595502 RepID=A0A420X1D7_9GAMM|nr:allantoin permease [Kushneria sinocarnis]RKR07557.1 purine-cytosine permease-like protein [Kushneria sinocarnis]
MTTRQSGVREAAPRSSDETLEDYTLRYAPRSFRRWRPSVVAITALGGIAYLADFSIGATIGLTHGTLNALLGILVAAVVIFATGLPIAYYCARYNIDLDLVTRGAGFGYYGSVLTAIIFATFTFIFFALEGSIMAQGLLLGLGIPLWLGYLISTLLVIPLVIYGMKALSTLQVWTSPIWLILMFGPVLWLIHRDPGMVSTWLAFDGDSGRGVNLAEVMLGAGVALSLMAQIGEQVDYLRFMPTRTAENRRAWWAGVLAAGPGWVILGALKQAIGAFLAVYIVSRVGNTSATEPVQQFVATFGQLVPGWLAMTLAVILVVISQIKINVTNAYSGSLAWTNAFTRVTGHYPGRLVFVIINLSIALALMEANMFAVLGDILGFYSNCAVAWVVTVASDIVFNKYLLGLSPRLPEFRRGMLHAVNPVGTVSFIASAGLSIAAYFGALGELLASYSPLVAIVVALVMTPLMAAITRGRYYLRQRDDGMATPRFLPDGTPGDTLHQCVACEATFERPDVLYSAQHQGVICSLCLSTGDRHAVPAPAQ